MSEQASNPDPDTDHDRLRASDADRERVATILHEAVGEGRLTMAEIDERLQQVYAAKTMGELRPITRDLPGHHLALPDSAAVSERSASNAAAQPSSRIGGTPTSGTAVAIMSGALRSGPWVVPEKFHAVAVMGGIELDLTQARFSAPEVTIEVFALMGGIEIIVPDDIRIDSHAFAFMGGIDHKHPADPPAGAPVVRITGFALMGGVEITRPKRRQLRRNR